MKLIIAVFYLVGVGFALHGWVNGNPGTTVIGLAVTGLGCWFTYHAARRAAARPIGRWRGW